MEGVHVGVEQGRNGRAGVLRTGGWMDGWLNANRPGGQSIADSPFIRPFILVHPDLPRVPPVPHSYIRSLNWFLHPLRGSYDVSFLGCAWPTPRGAQRERGRARERERGTERGYQQQEWEGHEGGQRMGNGEKEEKG